MIKKIVLLIFILHYIRKGRYPYNKRLHIFFRPLPDRFCTGVIELQNNSMDRHVFVFICRIIFSTTQVRRNTRSR